MAAVSPLPNVDAVADAMLEASQPAHTTPPRTAYHRIRASSPAAAIPATNAANQLVTFTSSGRPTPVKLLHKPLISNPAKPQHCTHDNPHPSPLPTPLRDSAPHNPNITLSSKRPPLPAQMASHRGPSRGLFDEVASAEDDENSRVFCKPRPRKLSPTSFR